jgi:glycosyltransferase involved in cell wall biosynthesis
VQYVGYVDPAERDELLGGARALLYPVQSPEPFGLVLVEAMMSGTPVAALGLGAVPELVEEEVTGAWEPPDGDIRAAVTRCLALDREAVRARALERFSPDRMAADYEAVFETVTQSVLR